MTINDIAKLAGVSITTVSKIVNGKHSGISQATRDKVLSIVKEYNYAPYAAARTQGSAKTLLIGCGLRDSAYARITMQGIIDAAYENGYAPIPCFYTTDTEAARYNELFVSHNVDGILWDGLDVPNAQAAKLPRVLLELSDDPSAEAISLDFQGFGYEATRQLAELGHQQIACFIDDALPGGHAFMLGYQRCMQEYDLRIEPRYCGAWEQLKADSLVVTGVVCQSFRIATSFVSRAQQRNFRVPEDVSVICLDLEGVGENAPGISRLTLPLPELGRYGCEALIAKIEGRALEKTYEGVCALSGAQSLAIPPNMRNRKIIVVGAMNMDTLMNLNCLPRLGETTTAKGHVTMPGGKGVNQAIGCARLGAEVCLIGRLGKDHDGNLLFEALRASGIDLRGVKMDTQQTTGHAYIYVQDDGESSIVIFRGANKNLSPEDVQSEVALFKNANYCLLQTEISYETVEASAKLAKENGVRVILKPAAIDTIGDALLGCVDIFLPNLNELNRLCPQDLTLEEKAQHFLDRGVRRVIVTLAHEGCYLRSRSRSRYFPAARFVPVDTTGAADAFAATLAVYLSDGYAIEEAIRYATVSAGASTTSQGVPPGLIDRETLELFITSKLE